MSQLCSLASTTGIMWPVLAALGRLPKSLHAELHHCASELRSLCCSILQQASAHCCQLIARWGIFRQLCTKWVPTCAALCKRLLLLCILPDVAALSTVCADTQGLQQTLLFVGDGINDLAALSAADTGFAVSASEANVAADLTTANTSVAGQQAYLHACLPPQKP